MLKLETSDKVVDVPQMLAQKTAIIIGKCWTQNRLINWIKFKKFLMEYFIIADYRADQVIRDARSISIYEP